MKKILISILLTSATYSYAQTINAEQIKKDNVTIRGNALHQLRADTSFLATKYYVDSVAGGGTFDTTSLSNRIDLKLDSVRRIAGTDTVVEYYDNGTQRFAFIDSVSAATIAASAWSLTGNASTVPGTNFIGTTDSAAWTWRTNNRTWFQLQVKGQLWGQTGLSTFLYDTTAGNSEQLMTSNLAIGDSSMKNIRFGTDTAIAHNNTALGFWSLRDLENGWGNTAVGAGTLTYTKGQWGATSHNPGTPYGFGYENTAVGFLTMHLNRTGFENFAGGTGALFKNPKPVGCVAVGVGTLSSSIDTSAGSTAVGFLALRDYTTSGGAGGNTAIGGTAMMSTTTGYNNVAVGGAALRDNQTGFSNVVVGQTAAAGNISGAGNTYIGTQSAQSNTGSRNVFYGSFTGGNSTALNDWLLIGFGGFNGSALEDTMKLPIVAKMGNGGQNDSSTARIKLIGKVQYNNGNNTILGKRLYLANTNGYLEYTAVVNDTTSGDAATINSVTGRFKKDSSGSTFTLTNSFITTNSAITLTANNAAIDATATSWTYFVGTTGIATIVFNAAPTADFKMIFKVEN